MRLMVQAVTIICFAQQCLALTYENTGAIYSIVTFLACVAPNMKFALYGVIPVPAWLAVSGLFAYDMYSTISHTVRDIGNILNPLPIRYFLFCRVEPQIRLDMSGAL